MSVTNPVFLPRNLTSESLTEGSSLLEETSNQALDRGINLAQIVAQVCLKVEAAGQGKAHLKADEIEAIQKKLGDVNSFLEKIESQLVENSSSKNISLTSTQEDLDLLGRIRVLMGKHSVLDKDSWDSKEAQTLQQALTRHSQLILQEASLKSNELNRIMEDSLELHQIARKCIEMLSRLHDNIISNQRSR